MWLVVVLVFARFPFNKPSSVDLMTISSSVNECSSSSSNIKKKFVSLCPRRNGRKIKNRDDHELDIDFCVELDMDVSKNLGVILS